MCVYKQTCTHTLTLSLLAITLSITFLISLFSKVPACFPLIYFSLSALLSFLSPSLFPSPLSHFLPLSIYLSPHPWITPFRLRLFSLRLPLFFRAFPPPCAPINHTPPPHHHLPSISVRCEMRCFVSTRIETRPGREGTKGRKGREDPRKGVKDGRWWRREQKSDDVERYRMGREGCRLFFSQLKLGYW